MRVRIKPIYYPTMPDELRNFMVEQTFIVRPLVFEIIGCYT